MWDDAGEDEGTLPVLPVASPSAVTSLAFSCSLAQADARIFYEQRDQCTSLSTTSPRLNLGSNHQRKLRFFLQSTLVTNVYHLI